MTNRGSIQNTDSTSRSHDTDVGVIAYRWWRSLTDRRAPAARRAWAELRRAHTIAEVSLTPAFVDLLTKIRDAGRRDEDLPARVAAMALTLAGVGRDRGGSSGPFAVAAGRSRKPSDRAAVPEVRFRRLLEIDDRAHLAATLRRTVQMVPSVPIPDLARSLYWWGDDRRRRWAEQYWAGFSIETDTSVDANSEEGS